MERKLNRPAKNTLRDWETLAARHFDVELAERRIAATWRDIRWNSADRLRARAERVAAWMRKDGFDDVKVLSFPADGRTAYGGWKMPLCWSPRRARLEIVSPVSAAGVLADYEKNPWNLVMFSASTPPRGVEAQLVRIPCPPARRDLSRVRGRIVLFDGTPDTNAVRRVRLAGALGVVTDAVSEYKDIRGAQDVAHAVAYRNNLLPWWEVPARERGFAFGISPDSGRRLRTLLDAGPVKVRALVDADLGPGELPVITGLLRGTTSQEILVTAHIDEPGANDNASGVGVALGIGRMLADVRRRGWKPVRGVRLFFSVETRALQSFLNTQPKFFRNGVAGLNIDMVGAAQDAPGMKIKIAPNMPALPDPTLPLLIEGLKRYPELRWKQAPDYGDNAMGDPAVGIPSLFVVQAPDRTYHTNLDTPAALSTEMIRKMGQWFGSYVGYLCSVGPDEVRDLARLGVRYSRQRLADLAKTAVDKYADQAGAFLEHHVAQERVRLKGLLKLMPPDPFVPWEPEVRAHPPRLNAEGLSEAMATRAFITNLANGLTPPPIRKVRKPLPPADPWKKRAARLVPLKMFRGIMAAESVPPAARRRLCRAADSDFGWAAPHWLQWALAWSNGKRTLAEIHRLLHLEGRGVPCERLVRTFDVLAETGFVRWRPYLTAKDVERTLRRAGVRPGMLLVTHSSLSSFGYVEGGAATFVATIERVLGRKGTLVMPTFSDCSLGNPPFDPALSPSRVGSVTEAFRHMAGVRRSAHPTHSVAARGPMAGMLTEGHTASMAPMAREGFWGRFIEHDGWVLMMAPLRTNTLMHAAELWSGVKLPGLVLARERGRRGSPQVMPSGPWHSNWFDLVYERLRKRGLLAEAKLGDATVYLMRGRDVVENGLALFRRDPLTVLKKNCRCPFCLAVMKNHGVEPTVQKP